MAVAYTWTISTCEHDIATGGREFFMARLKAALKQPEEEDG